MDYKACWGSCQAGVGCDVMAQNSQQYFLGVFLFFNFQTTRAPKAISLMEVFQNLLDDPEVTANLYCNFAYLYWEGCVICSKYLQ